MNQAPAPRVSVIICTLNRAEYLAQALSGVARLRDAVFEIIVVLGPSQDRTVDLIERWASLIKVTSCNVPNLSSARNQGLAIAEGEIIAFLDDDAVPHPDWLSRLMRHFEDPRIGGVGGYTVGRQGTAFQARKIVCDRHGSAHMMSDYFDERLLNIPGSWLYPAPMGTNVAFRRAALAAIGGFDPAYAYFLDETDVCLRLVDAGWQIVFEPSALVWHQFADSMMRNSRRQPTELKTICASKAYFVHRHGHSAGDLEGLTAAVGHLLAFAREKHALVQRLHQEGSLDAITLARLSQEIDAGLAAGERAAMSPLRQEEQTPGRSTGGGFLAFEPPRHPILHVVFVCRHYPPRGEGGIARWTWLAARGLAQRGHTVHVVAEAREAPIIRYEDGIWLHTIHPAQNAFSDVMAEWQVPPPAASWATAVRDHLPVLEGFGASVLSFPIWDVEGIGALHRTSMAVACSLHTTSALHGDGGAMDLRHIVRLQGGLSPALAESKALAHAGMIIANTHAALHDIERTSGVSFRARAVVVPHGTPIAQNPIEVPDVGPIRVLFVGRNERRKGIDLALAALENAFAAGANVQATVIGCADLALAQGTPLAEHLSNGRLRLPGFLPREALDAAYAAHHLLIMPSRYESFGLVAIEAMAHGVPVIATSVGGLPEVVADGVSGHLVALDEDTPRVIANHIGRLAANREALRALSKGAYARAKAQFDADVMARGLEAAFVKMGDNIFAGTANAQ